MQHILSCPPLPLSDFDSNPNFNVVIAYEDFETGKNAKRTYDYLVENLGGDCQFSNQMWKFDVLNIPKLREIARDDAAAADIVVISCHGDDLPSQVKAWLESWLVRSAKPMALVALFDRPTENAARTRAVRKFLADAARRGNMEFFAQPDEWPDGTHPKDVFHFEPNHSLNQRTLSTLAGVVQRDISTLRWNSLD